MVLERPSGVFRGKPKILIVFLSPAELTGGFGDTARESREFTISLQTR